MLPLRDRAGNALVDFRIANESDVDAAPGPMPLSLVVVTVGGRVLLVFDTYRRQWELPGGMREPGENARRTAARELAEETGIADATLTCAALVEFDLRRPDRREFAAVFRTELPTEPRLIVNDEVSGFRWWNPQSSVEDDTSPLDTEIARRVVANRR